MHGAGITPVGHYDTRLLRLRWIVQPHYTTHAAMLAPRCIQTLGARHTLACSPAYL